MNNASQLYQAGTFACILFDKTFKVTVCRPENEDLLREIIELLIPGKRISQLQLKRNEQSGLVVSEKTVIFDLLCTEADSGDSFIVELQCAEQRSYQDRMLCYATYPIREQLAQKLKERKSSEAIDRMDYTLKPVYVISLVNFELAHEGASALEDNGLISRYSVRNDWNGEPMTEALHFVYVELDRLKYREDEAERCKTLLERFVFSMKYMHTMTAKPECFTDPLIERLYEVTELASMTIEERENYEKQMRTELDIIAERQFACDKAREKGRLEERLENAKALLVAGVKKDVISSSLHIPLEELEKLKESL